MTTTTLAMSDVKNEVTEQWIQHVVGRNWEIYWASDSTETETPNDTPSDSHDEKGDTNHDTPLESPPKRRKVQPDGTGVNGGEERHASDLHDNEPNAHAEHDMEEEEDDDEDDWYAGSIQSFVTFEADKNGNEIKSRPVFRVLFVGDEEIYEMCVEPTILRPCARTWIKRSLALMNGPEKLSMKLPLHQQLPCDTRRLHDEQDLLKIEQSLKEELEPVHKLSSKAWGNLIAKGAAVPGWNELVRIREMILLIRQQIYLRSWLTCSDHEDIHGRSHSSSLYPDDDQPPSDVYISFLVDNLQSAARCCSWFYRCYVLLFRILNSQGDKGNPRLTKTTIFKLFAEDGREVLSELLSLDCTVTALKRKRKGTSSSSTTNTAVSVSTPLKSRRTKRKRTRNGTFEFFTVDETTGEKCMTAELDDFQSISFVKQMVERLADVDQRWFSLSIGRMLRAISIHVILPIINWEQRSQFYLGETDALRIQDMDGNHVSDTSLDDVEDDDSFDPENYQPSVRFGDIEALLERSRTDHVLSSCDFSSVATALRKKLEGIAAFEKSCWYNIERIPSEEGSHECPDNDEVLCAIHQLIETAARKDSSVWNVDPLGQNDSSLNLSMLEDAAEYRRYLLDLKHAETVRERTLFIEGLLSQRSSLPCLPTRDTPETLKVEDKEKFMYSVDQRIQALGTLLSKNATLFEQHKDTLEKMEGNGQSMRPSLDSMLAELQKIPIISIVEEMILTRLDIGTWFEQADRVLGQTLPKFNDVSEIKVGLDQLLSAQSPRRRQLVSSLRSCVEADTELQKFAERDLTSFCETLVNKTTHLYTKSSVWKERCDSIFTTLRYHDNPAAWSADADGPVKNTGMVDLKRIEDLLQEYPKLEICVETDFKSLSVAYDECEQWSESITDLLFREDTTFAEILVSVEAANQPEGRPKGIIVQPTRQVLDTVVDFLRWHGSVKELVQTKFRDMSAAYNVLLEGLEIVELYGESRTSADVQYKVKREELRELLREKLDSRKAVRSFQRIKLQSHHITENVLDEMIKETRDRREGLPLFSLLLLSWRVEAEKFADETMRGEDPKSDCSFESASALKGAMPTDEATPSHSQDVFSIQSTGMSEFNSLLEEADKTTRTITEAIAASKAVLRDCLRDFDAVRSHFASLKDFSLLIRRDSMPRKLLSLSRSIEGKLDKEMKLFGWLTRAIQYVNVLREDDNEEAPGASSKSLFPPVDVERMPFDVLVKLNESKPEFVTGMGDFTLVLLRLKELFEAAKKWQDEVSNETLLSLRGGKRRTTATGDNAEIDDGQQQIDIARVAQMCTSPILKKIAMPREEAVRSMLEKTKKFEVLLQDFIGKDFSGRYPDRIQLPSSNSLIDEDGRFILLRLTGSPLFVELKSSIDNISSVADDVLADTPGKATFDWICKAVTWIEELSSFIDRDKIGHNQLSVEKSAVLNLLNMADAMLLDVPDDLRKTLSKYGILVSTSKDGRLTVKSKKGSAHHSIGTTAIRWSPVLFEALKEDVGRTEAWEQELKGFSEKCHGFRQSISPESSEAKDVVLCHTLAEEISELLWEASELVVVPGKEWVDIGEAIKGELADFLESKSTPEIERMYAEQVLNVDSSIAQDRGLLLDCLVDRASVVGVVPEPDCTFAEKNNNDNLFRVAARNLISRGLEQGITMIASDLDDSGDSMGLCKLRAWDIEESLFRFLQAKSEDKPSPRYREKVRCLKRAFSDLCNRTLCLQVVCGDMDFDKLVRMSSDQLASPQIRRDRAAIEARAKEKTILTRSLAKKEKKQEREEGDGKLAATNGTKGETKPSALEKQSFGNLTNGEKDGDSINDPTHRAGPVEKELLKPVTRSSGRPPPPPSLADTLRSQPRDSNGLPHILNASGSDQFTLEAASILFSASFVPKSLLKPNAERMLPQRLDDPGRTKITEFIAFLSGKRNSNNWDIYVLRLVPCSDADAKEYKKFYKDFEGKQRIAMFRLPSKSKLFLITPKFHREVKDLIRLENASSTYGVLLLRTGDL